MHCLMLGKDHSRQVHLGLAANIIQGCVEEDS